MAVEQRAERHRRSAEIIQENLDAHDAALSDEFKQRYPVQSRIDIEVEHPNRWLAILPVRVDSETTRTSEGRLLATARGRQALERQLEPLLVEIPRRYPLTYFNYQRTGASSGSRWAIRHDDARTAP